MGRDPNIYGTDNTDFASKIADEALTPKAGDLADFWGDSVDQDARSKGTGEDSDNDCCNVPVKVIRGEAAGHDQDTDPLNMSKGGQRHRRGPEGPQPLSKEPGN